MEIQNNRLLVSFDYDQKSHKLGDLELILMQKDSDFNYGKVTAKLIAKPKIVFNGKWGKEADVSFDIEVGDILIFDYLAELNGTDYDENSKFVDGVYLRGKIVDGKVEAIGACIFYQEVFNTLQSSTIILISEPEKDVFQTIYSGKHKGSRCVFGHWSRSPLLRSNKYVENSLFNNLFCGYEQDLIYVEGVGAMNEFVLYEKTEGEVERNMVERNGLIVNLYRLGGEAVWESIKVLGFGKGVDDELNGIEEGHITKRNIHTDEISLGNGKFLARYNCLIGGHFTND